MADGTSTPSNAGPNMAADTAIADVVHRQSNSLHNVRALLTAIDAIAAELDEDDRKDHLRRVVRMADQAVIEVQAAFQPHI